MINARFDRLKSCTKIELKENLQKGSRYNDFMLQRSEFSKRLFIKVVHTGKFILRLNHKHITTKPHSGILLSLSRLLS